MSRVSLCTRASNACADATAPDNNVNMITAQGRRDDSADVDPSQSPTEPNANPHPRGPAEGAYQAQADTGWGRILNVEQPHASQSEKIGGRTTRNRADLRESFGLPRHMIGAAGRGELWQRNRSRARLHTPCMDGGGAEGGRPSAAVTSDWS